jgi:hypothetical protein
MYASIPTPTWARVWSAPDVCTVPLQEKNEDHVPVNALPEPEDDQEQSTGGF